MDGGGGKWDCENYDMDVDYDPDEQATDATDPVAAAATATVDIVVEVGDSPPHSPTFSPFTQLLDRGSMESGKFTSIHQLIDASLPVDSLLGEGVADLLLRRKICRGMLDELRKSNSQGDASTGPLPRSPHMLCSEKQEGLLHGEVMSDQYVDLFWILFAQTCGLGD